MTDINISISVGELFDRYSILLIKKNKIIDKDKIEFINREIESLQKYVLQYDLISNDNFKELIEINKKLWNIEDSIRLKEKNNQFDEEFINLARNVYINNDKRSHIKLNINKKYSSYYREIKIYTATPASIDLK